MNKDLSQLETKLQYNFKNIDLLKEALIHRSFKIDISKDTIGNNERLEFLGDAVLELAVTQFLFDNYPDYPEGDLTSFRAALVRTESLAEEATRLGFGEFIYMSNGEEATGGRERPYILANTVEAIIGALCLDNNYEAASDFVNREICYKAKEIIENRLDIDSKSKLQEIAQEVLKITPKYKMISAKGPDHSKIFTMGLMLGEQLITQAEGDSKQKAEQNAADLALKNWDELLEKYFN